MTCFGDSGSPLVQFDQNRAIVIGIVGGGKTMTKDICGPGILYYQRTSLFIPWIAWIIESNMRLEMSPATEVKNVKTQENKSEGNNNNYMTIKITLIFYIVINLIRDNF